MSLERRRKSARAVRAPRGVIGLDPSGEVPHAVPSLDESPRRIVGSLPDGALEPDLTVGRKLLETFSQLTEGDVGCPRDVIVIELRRLAHIHEVNLAGMKFLPVRDGVIPSQHITRDHSGEIDGVLGGAELRGVAKFDLLRSR